MMPNIPALFAEAGSIISLHIGFAGWRRNRAQEPQASRKAALGQMSLVELRALQPMLRDGATAKPEWDPQLPSGPKPRNRRNPHERRRQVAGFRAAFVRKHGRKSQPADVRAGLGFPRRASHSYLREQVPATA